MAGKIELLRTERRDMRVLVVGAVEVCFHGERAVAFKYPDGRLFTRVDGSRAEEQSANAYTMRDEHVPVFSAEFDDRLAGLLSA